MNNDETILYELKALNANLSALLKEFKSCKEEEKERYRVGKQFLEVHLESIDNNIVYTGKDLRRTLTTR